MRRVRRFQPPGETRTVSGDVEIPVRAGHVEAFTDEAHGVGVGLEEAEVGVAVDREACFGERGADAHQVGCRNPGCGDDDVGWRRFVETALQIGGADDRPDVGGEPA